MKSSHFSHNNESSRTNQDSQQLKQDNDLSDVSAGMTSTRNNWAKLANELDEVDPSDHSEWDRTECHENEKAPLTEYPQIGDYESTEGIVWDENSLSSSPQRYSEPTPHGANRSFDKIDEDYETRSRNRAHSVWNHGEWSVKGHDYGKKEVYQERNSGRPNNNRYYPNDRYQRERRNYNSDTRTSTRTGSYHQDYRAGSRNDRGNFVQSPDERRPQQDNPPNYRISGRRSQGYRNDSQSSLPNDRINNRYNDRRDCRRILGDYQQNYTLGSSGGCRREISNYSNDNFRVFPSGGQNDSNPWRRNDYSGNYYGVDNRRSRYGRRENLEPTIGALGKRGEPLSLAEELASQRAKRGGMVNSFDPNGRSKTNVKPHQADESSQQDPVSYGDRTPLEIVDLEKMTMTELVNEARHQDLQTFEGEQRRELLNRVLRARIQQNGMMFGEGTLEILPDEFGFLRSSETNYVSCPDDIYISPSQIRRFGLRNGLVISGQIRPPKERERYFALLRVESINGENPNLLASKFFFDDLVVARPVKQLKFEPSQNSIVTGEANSDPLSQTTRIATLRAIDLITPIAFGQRTLVVYPPQAEKCRFLRDLSKSIIDNNPETFVFVLLVDERPEVITETRRYLKGSRCEVVGSTFDETSGRHIQITEILFEKAKRMVEYGQDVVIVMDSLTRLIRAWNTNRFVPDSSFNETLDPVSLQRPKRLFSSARRIDGGGSLTVFGAIQYDENSSTDLQTLNEFKEIANAKIWLNLDIHDANSPIMINASKCFVRDVKDFFTEEDYPQYLKLHAELEKMEAQDRERFLAQKIAQTTNNTELLQSFK